MSESTVKSQEAQLQQLLSALLDGELTDQQREELSELLASDASAREEYARMMQVHALMKWSAAAPATVATGFMPSEAGDIQADPMNTERAKTLPPAEAQTSKRSVLFGLTPWLMLAACLLLVVTGSYLLKPSPDGPNAAPQVAAASQKTGRITQQWKPVWADPNAEVANWSQLVVGQELDLVSGRIACLFDVGAEVILQGPAKVRVLGPMLLEVEHGDLTARVSEQGRGFSVKTAVGKVIDLGTEFGVSVADGGETELVVFDGMVDLHTNQVDESRESRNDKSHYRLEMGQGVRVASQGAMSRITNVDVDRYPRSSSFFQQRRAGTPVIAAVEDNLREMGVGHYYQISRGGFEEDCTAYVDRHYQWNGLSKAGLPEFLKGADYVLTFNDDKVLQDLVPTLKLSQPATVYVFWDVRMAVPEWLANDFEKADVQIGMDETKPAVQGRIAIGPGESVDKKFDVWQRQVLDFRQPLVLGGVGAKDYEVKGSMYGIAAAPLGEAL